VDITGASSATNTNKIPTAAPKLPSGLCVTKKTICCTSVRFGGSTKMSGGAAIAWPVWSPGSAVLPRSSAIISSFPFPFV
jgi:hypothetical protein